MQPIKLSFLKSNIKPFVSYSSVDVCLILWHHQILNRTKEQRGAVTLTSVLHDPGLGDWGVGHGVGQGPHVLGQLLKLLPLLTLYGGLQGVQVLQLLQSDLHRLDLWPEQHDFLVFLLQLNRTNTINALVTRFCQQSAFFGHYY